MLTKIYCTFYESLILKESNNNSLSLQSLPVQGLPMYSTFVFSNTKATLFSLKMMSWFAYPEKFSLNF